MPDLNDNCPISSQPNEKSTFEERAKEDDLSEFPSDNCLEETADSSVVISGSAENESKTLEEALLKFDIKLPLSIVETLKEYCEQLWTWNERLNLTRHTTFDKFVERDLLDSIHLANQFQSGEHVLDVGSGGGTPGLVVAILRPDVVVELCEATGKKAEALGNIVDAIGVNVTVWKAKAEDLLRERRFHTLSVRAVGKIRELLLMFAPVWNSFGRLLMIKGPNWISERGEARHYNMFNNLALRKVDEYGVVEAERSSVILQVCRKSRIDEMKRRAQDRLEGKPYDGDIEEILVDNSAVSSRELRNNVQRKGFRNSSSRRGVSNKRHISSDDNRSNSSGSQLDRPAKTPKGWTGKKRDFRDYQKRSERENDVNSQDVRSRTARGRKNNRPTRDK